MTQKEYHKQINARFYAYIEENFPQYKIDSSEGYGRIYLIHKGIMGSNLSAVKNKNSIEYHQSRHDLCCMDYVDEFIKEDMKKIENYLNDNIIPFVNLLKRDSK
jgi:hypothetical protein